MLHNNARQLNSGSWEVAAKIGTGLAHECDQVLKVGLVVLGRSRVLDRLPGDEQAAESKPPRSKAAEVFVRLGQREGPANKRDKFLVHPKPTGFAFPGGSVGFCWQLAGTTNVYAFRSKFNR